MRDRQRIVDNLEKLYRDELGRSAEAESGDVARLDFEFQRDQIYLEVLLDLRDRLSDLLGEAPEEAESTSSLLDKAQKLRNLTRLR